MFLELATTTGAIAGALVAGFVHPTVLFVVFGLVLGASAIPVMTRLREELREGCEMIAGRQA